MADSIPRKLFYKIGEVCELTDTQPYVLRFWESEFPQLAPKKSPSGQRLYRKKDIDLVIEIKKLLYQEGYTIAGARKKLGMSEGPEGNGEILPAGEDRPPESAPRSVRLVIAQLEEILRILDRTDRRLLGRHGAAKE
ncbi:MAG: MerR family transcriptional regulator [Acidobacteria bacterium]|jgi:DNA-binding transcriptional MerR regulator|nr:MerR family transcriptional regulator [Acidobacteriota bacterium]